MSKLLVVSAVATSLLVVGTIGAHSASALPSGAPDAVVPECYRVTLEWLGLEPFVLVCRPV